MPYIYNADLWCDSCGVGIMKKIREETPELIPDQTWNQGSYDSGDWPKTVGEDEENDCPQHCGGGEDCLEAEELPSGWKIGALLSRNLTEDGVRYVQGQINIFPSEVTEFWLKAFEGYGLKAHVVLSKEKVRETLSKCLATDEVPEEPWLSLGSYSSGTMRTEDLIPKFMNVLGDYPSEKGMLQEIEGRIKTAWEKRENPKDTFSEEWDPSNPYWTSEEAGYDLNETLWDAMGRHCPPFTWFCAHEGDGADYGVWVCQEALQGALQGGSLVVVENNPEDTAIVLVTGDSLILRDVPVEVVVTDDPSDVEWLLQGSTRYCEIYGKERITEVRALYQVMEDGEDGGVREVWVI